MGDIGLRGVEGKGLKGGSGSHRMWAWGPPTCTPPPLSPWGRQEAAHPRVSGWGKGTGCGYGWGEGSGSHIFPTFLQASQWVSLWIKRNRLGVGGWEEMDRKHPDYSPEGHGLLLWVPHSGAGPHRLEGTLRVKAQKRTGMGVGTAEREMASHPFLQEGCPLAWKIITHSQDPLPTRT